jgi:hypothetical protein
MAAWFEDQADIFLAGQEVTTDPVIDGVNRNGIQFSYNPFSSK